MKSVSISKQLFYILVFLLPLNLGNHYVIRDSYVFGLLVDYLIPTIFVQDVLAVILLVTWFIEILVKKQSLKAFSLNKEVQLLTLFVFTLFLSVLISDRQLPSLTYFLRTLIYFFVMVYISFELWIKTDFKKIVSITSISVVLVSILGIFQFANQSSVFNNYVFFGEQPYNQFTRGLTVEDLFGRQIIPPYGLFRHPNVFAGYLSIVLLWLIASLVVYARVIKDKDHYHFNLDILNIKKGWFLYLSLVLGLITLFLTVSYISYICFGVSLALFLLRSKKLVFLCSLLILLFSFLISTTYLSKVSFMNNSPSIFRRVGLLNSSYKIIKEKPLFGVGYGISTVYIEKNLDIYNTVRFAQPAHNIFVLVFSEAGVFAFLLLLFAVFLLLNNSTNLLLSINIFQIIFLGSFDHYFFTMHQTHLLMWIILGLTLLQSSVYDYN